MSGLARYQWLQADTLNNCKYADFRIAHINPNIINTLFRICGSNRVTFYGTDQEVNRELKRYGSILE